MEFSPAIITFAGVASGFENTLAAIWKCVLLQSNLIAIPLPKPYNRDVESQPSMAWANKIELHTSGPKASLRAAIFQHLGVLRDMCRNSGRKYTFVMSEGTWWHSSIRRSVSSPTKMVALVEVLATAITVCVIRKSAYPTALWMWLPAFSRFLLNMIMNISLLSLFLRKCFFLSIEDHGWGYIHWWPDLATSSSSMSSIFCAGTSRIPIKHHWRMAIMSFNILAVLPAYFFICRIPLPGNSV